MKITVEFSGSVSFFSFLFFLSSFDFVRRGGKKKRRRREPKSQGTGTKRKGEKKRSLQYMPVHVHTYSYTKYYNVCITIMYNYIQYSP